MAEKYMDNLGKEFETLRMQSMTDKQVMPAIHLGELYERYKETDMEKCVKFVLEVLKTRGYIMMEEILCDWKEAKNKIELQVINKEWNEERLKTLPHQDYLNLAVIARLGINEGKYAKSSMIVTYEMLDYWKISEKELFTAGLSNLKEKEFMIEDLEERDIYKIGQVMKAYVRVKRL